jgi:hypothetical protein
LGKVNRSQSDNPNFKRRIERLPAIAYNGRERFKISMTPAAYLDFAKAYLRLSPEGRRWIRSRRRKKDRRPQGGRLPLLDDKLSRWDMIHKLLICDRAFRDHVPDGQLQILGRERRLVYARFVPFGFVNLLIYGRLLEAYGIAYDDDAETRLVKFFFLWREWNDLRDIHSLDAGLATFERKAEPQPPFLLLRTLIDAVMGEGALAEDYPAFSNYLRAFMEKSPAFLTGAPTAHRLKEAATFLVMTGYSIMFPKIPQILVGPVQDLAPWFYSLDELSDLHRDKAAKKATYFATLADPIEEIRRLYAVCEERFRSEAPAPDRVLSLMEFFMEETVQTYESGFDLETEFFGAPARAAIRTAGPSGSGTAAGT